MSSNNYPSSHHHHHQHHVPSSKNPGQQYKPSLPNHNVNQVFHQQPLAGGYVRPEYVAPQQWTSFSSTQNQYGSSQISLGGLEGVENAPGRGGGHMAAASISTQAQAGALTATATMASAHRHHHNSAGIRQTSGTGQGGYDYAAAYAHESSYPQQSPVSTPSTSSESGQPLYPSSGAQQQQTQQQYFSYSTVPQGTGATYASAYQTAIPTPPILSTQQQSRAAAARTTTTSEQRRAVQDSEKPASPIFKPMSYQPLPVTPVAAQTPPKRVHPRSGKGSLLAAAVNHASSQLPSAPPATAAKSAIPETSYSTGPSYQTTNVQAAAQQPISMLRTPIHAAAARQAPASTPVTSTSQVPSKYRAVFSTAKGKGEPVQSLPDTNPDSAAVAPYELARHQEQRQHPVERQQHQQPYHYPPQPQQQQNQRQQQQNQRQQQQPQQQQQQLQWQQHLDSHQQLNAGTRSPPLTPNAPSYQAPQTHYEAAPQFQAQREGQQAQSQAYIPTQTQNPPPKPSRDPPQYYETRHEPQLRESAPIPQSQPEYSNHHPPPAPQHLPQSTPQVQGTPEPEPRQPPRVDPAALGQEMRDMLERMRFYQSQDPQTFQAVWENVRKSNSSTAQIAGGADDGHPKAIMSGASNPPQHRVASISPLADSPLARPADVASAATSTLGEDSSHARPSLQSDHGQGSGSGVGSSGIGGKDADNRPPPPVPVPQTIRARAQYLTQPIQSASIGRPRLSHTQGALPQTQTPNGSLPSAVDVPEKPRSAHKHGWDLKQKKHIAGVAAKYLSGISDKQVPEEAVMDLLNKNNHFVSLCEGLESRGLRFDRGAFARRLLQETSVAELAKKPLGGSADTGGHSRGAKVLGEVHDNQDGNIRRAHPEVNQIHPMPKPAAMTNAAIAAADKATPHATYSRERPREPFTAAVLSPSKTPTAQTTQTAALPTPPASIVQTTQQLFPASSSSTSSSPFFPPSLSDPSPQIAEGAITPQHLNHTTSAYEIPGRQTSVKAARKPPQLYLPVKSSAQQSRQFLPPSMAHRATPTPPPRPSPNFTMELEPSPIEIESDPTEELQVERDPGGKPNNHSQFEQGPTSASLPRVETLRQSKSLVVKLPVRSHEISIVEPPVPRNSQPLTGSPVPTRPLSTLPLNTKLPPTNIPPTIDLTGMTPTPEPQAPLAHQSKEPPNIAKMNTKEILPASITPKVSEQENAPEPEVVFHTPVVDLIRRSQVARKSSYNQPNIASDVLLAAGRHPTLGGLNSDLTVLRRALPSIFNPPVDLAAIRWDVLDPPAPGDNDETDDESFMTLPAAVSVGRPGTAGAVAAMATAPGPKRRGRPTGRGKHIKAPLFQPSSQTPSQPLSQPSPQLSLQPASRPRGKGGRKAAVARPVNSLSTGATDGSGAGITRISSPSGNSRGRSGSVNRSNEPFYVNPSRRDRSSVGSSALLNDTTPQGGSRIAVIISPHNASSSSNALAAPAPLDDRKRKSEGKPVNARPGKNPKLAISPMRPSGYKVFPCRWKQCEAQLHNYETLRRHVMKKHKHAANNGFFECQWEGCAKDSQIPNLPEKTAFQFPNEEVWEQHVLTHLEQVKEQFGLGPAVLASGELFRTMYESQNPPKLTRLDYESGVSDVDYMSDRDGNRVTPIAVPAPSGYPFAPPPGYKMNSHFRNAHDIKYEKETKAAKTFASEIEGGRATGAGAAEEGGRPWNDDGDGWKEDYAAEVEDSPEPDPGAKTGPGDASPD